jgi:hypothetical protein
VYLRLSRHPETLVYCTILLAWGGGTARSHRSQRRNKELTHVLDISFVSAFIAPIMGNLT